MATYNVARFDGLEIGNATIRLDRGDAIPRGNSVSIRGDVRNPKKKRFHRYFPRDTSARRLVPTASRMRDAARAETTFLHASTPGFDITRACRIKEYEDLH